MGDSVKYTSDEWVEVQKHIKISSFDVSSQSEFVMLVSSFGENRTYSIEQVIAYLEEKIRSSDSRVKEYLDLQQALFGDFDMVPLYMGSQPKIVAWRLEHGK